MDCVYFGRYLSKPYFYVSYFVCFEICKILSRTNQCNLSKYLCKNICKNISAVFKDILTRQMIKNIRKIIQNDIFHRIHTSRYKVNRGI
jgi:hypothetical protein